jgi:hypothetical protein
MLACEDHRVHLQVQARGVENSPACERFCRLEASSLHHPLGHAVCFAAVHARLGFRKAPHLHNQILGLCVCVCVCMSERERERERERDASVQIKYGFSENNVTANRSHTTVPKDIVVSGSALCIEPTSSLNLLRLGYTRSRFTWNPGRWERGAAALRDAGPNV